MNLLQTDTKTNGAGTKEWLAATKDMVISVFHVFSPELLRGNHPVIMGDFLLAAHDSDSITKAMDAICDEADTRSDPAFAAAAHRTLARNEW